jgi:hypothetical protein
MGLNLFSRYVNSLAGLHNEEPHSLYSSSNISRMIKSIRKRWTGHVTRVGEKMNAYRILLGKSEGKRPLGRQRRRWVDNIKIDLRERENGVGWTGFIWLRIWTSGGLL